MNRSPSHCWTNGLLRLEVHNLGLMALTGVLSEETKLPQPLSVSVSADIANPDFFAPDTPLTASKSYLDLKRAVVDALPADRHFTLIEAIADHVIETLVFDPRIVRVEVKIVKLAIAEAGESIGVTMSRERS